MTISIRYARGLVKLNNSSPASQVLQEERAGQWAAALRITIDLEHVLRDRPQRHWVAILLCAISGAFPIGIGLGMIPYDASKLHAPSWVIVVAGAVFWLGGLMLLAKDKPRVANGLAFVMLLLFSAMGAWVSLLGEEAAFTDGDDGALAGWGVTLARAMFGFGSLLCMLMALVALRRFIKGDVDGDSLFK